MVIKWNDKVNLVFTAGLADANYVCECIYIYIYNHIICEERCNKTWSDVLVNVGHEHKTTFQSCPLILHWLRKYATFVDYLDRFEIILVPV